MSKLTKRQAQAHEEAVRLLAKETLSTDEKELVFQKFREDAQHVNSRTGAFFTPLGLARDLAIHIPREYGGTVKVVDLCAGIGVLGYAAHEGDDMWSKYHMDITCVEINPDYVEVGKKVLPEATWICGDVLDPDLLARLGKFDFAIANPPFGSISSTHRKSYQNGCFEYMVIEAASRIASGGAFIIPQMSVPFMYSGKQEHVWLQSGRARQFEASTGIKLEFNLGIDTSYYKNDWHCTQPTCEIVCCEFEKGNCSYENFKLRSWDAEYSAGPDLLCPDTRRGSVSPGTAL